jgi:ABC-type multidrug transport system ATPase subunit
MKPLEVKNVNKFYNDFIALKNINFFVDEGEIFGIIGPNGAGKSTLIKIITSAIKPTSGKVFIFGKDNIQRSVISKFFGVVFQEVNLDSKLTVKENLFFHSILYDFSSRKANELIDYFSEKFNFKKYLDFKIEKISGGTKRMVELARALFHNPKILILDEPTVGLDINSRQNFWKFVLELNEKNKITIILTSHHIDEIKLCSRILYLQNGEISFIGKSEEFLTSYYGKN